MHIEVREALKIGNSNLANSTTGKLDSSVLLAKVLKISNPLNLTLKKLDKISNKEFEEFLLLIERRKKGEPIAFITGYKEFWSLDFHVSQDTLIPRPETELIIESVLKKFDNASYSILDLGAGSGCIGISLLTELTKSVCTSVDLSLNTLEYAKKNALKHNVIDRITFIHSNWLDDVPKQKFDIIVSNPPYIKLEDVKNLSKDVVNFEPLSALTDFNDGLDHYRYILNQLEIYMNETSLCFFEFGIDQSQSLKELLINKNYNILEIKKDLSNIDRIVIFNKNKF